MQLKAVLFICTSKYGLGTSWQEAIAAFMGTLWCSVLMFSLVQKENLTLCPHFFIDTCKRYVYSKMPRQNILQGNRFKKSVHLVKGAFWICPCSLHLLWDISILSNLAYWYAHTQHSRMNSWHVQVRIEADLNPALHMAFAQVYSAFPPRNIL